ncbi:MAG: hypothetical protein RI995_1838 [Bacteroidota bacterium]
MKPKIVTIVSRMNLGGIAKIIAQVINETNSEFEHILITGKCAENEIDYLKSNIVNCQIIYVETLGRKIGITSDIRALLTITKLLKKINPKIIHTHASKAGVLGRVSGKLSGLGPRIIHTYHGHVIQGYFNLFANLIILNIERFLAKSTDYLIAVSNSVKEELLSKNVGIESQWKVIFPGIDAATSFKKFINKDKLNLLWIGRFEPIKNPMLAIKAYELLDSTNRDWFRLTMVGDGKLIESCKDYARQKNLNIDFTGWIEAPFNFDADLLLMTSKNEGFGLVILEAAAQGIPAIVTNISGVKDFIENNVTGWIVEQTPTAFIKILLELKNNQESINAVGIRASEKLERLFTFEKMIKNYEKLYKEILIEAH